MIDAAKSTPRLQAQAAPHGEANAPPHWPTELTRPARRWWIAVIISCAVALPAAWLLSYAAALPFFLGLFFFMLFGLLLGAVAFRLASAGKPYSMGSLLAGTTLIVAVTCGASLYKEAQDFPDDLARRVSLRTRDIGPGTVKDFRRALAGDIRSFLSDRFGPSPIWGYVRWVVTSGKIKPGDISTLSGGVSVPVAQTTGWWAFRVVASVALLAFGVASQTLLLRTGTPTEKM